MRPAGPKPAAATESRMPPFVLPVFLWHRIVVKSVILCLLPVIRDPMQHLGKDPGRGIPTLHVLQ